MPLSRSSRIQSGPSCTLPSNRQSLYTLHFLLGSIDGEQTSFQRQAQHVLPQADNVFVSSKPTYALEIPCGSIFEKKHQFTKIACGSIAGEFFANWNLGCSFCKVVLAPLQKTHNFFQLSRSACMSLPLSHTHTLSRRHSVEPLSHCAQPRRISRDLKLELHK